MKMKLQLTIGILWTPQEVVGIFRFQILQK